MEPKDLKERIEQNMYKTLGYVEGEKVLKIMTKGKSNPKYLKDKTIVFETSFYETESNPAFQVYAKTQQGKEVGLLEYRFVKDDEIEIFRLKILDENYRNCGIKTTIVKCLESVAQKAKIKTIIGNLNDLEKNGESCEKTFEKLKYRIYTDPCSRHKCFYKDFEYTNLKEESDLKL